MECEQSDHCVLVQIAVQKTRKVSKYPRRNSSDEFKVSEEFSSRGKPDRDL